MTDSLKERLAKRKEFFTNDGAHWLMSPVPDQDCKEALARIEELEHNKTTLIAQINRLATMVNEARATIAKLEGENERMREALKAIRDYQAYDGPSAVASAALQKNEIAR